MKRKTFYELLIGLSIALVFAGVALRVNEILQEDNNKTALSQKNQPLTDPNENPSYDEKGAAIVRLYGSTIQGYSQRYDLDWRLVLAVMHQESRFSVDAQSQSGALGLMQIMPETFEGIAEELGLDDITNPKSNIVAGIQHLASLNDAFPGATPDDRMRLMLAAYNAGIGRVLDAQKLAEFMNDDPLTWEGVSNALPLLSKRFSTLHGRVWDTARPRNGYFNDYKQTIDYVDHVMAYYAQYRKQYQ